jgi:peptidyl-prolyl cis-trans isomerase C
MQRALFSIFLAAAAFGLPASAADDPVVAIVDGEQITRSDLEEAKGQLPEQFRQLPLEAVFEPLLNRVIDQKLLSEEAEASDLEANPEVQADIAQARSAVLQQALLEQAIEEGSTEERLQQAYNELSAQPGFAEEEVKAQHILVETEEKASELIGQLEAGAAFAELAAEHSTDPSAANNAGDLGWFTRGQMVEPFSEAAFAAEPGTIVEEPVQSQFGWHVIKVDERRTKVPTFEETEPQIREQVAREIVNGMLEELRGGAEIERFNLDGSPAPAAE